MSCLPIFCRRNTPVTDQEVVEGDAVFNRTARDLAIKLSDTISFGRDETRRALADRLLELTEPLASGAASKVRVLAAKQVLSRNLAAQGLEPKQCQQAIDDFMSDVLTRAMYKLYCRMGRNQTGDDLVGLCNRGAKQLFAYGYSTDAEDTYLKIYTHYKMLAHIIL